MRVSPQLRKLIPFSLGLLLILAISTIAVVYLAREDLASGQRCAGNSCWGYSLQQFDFLNRTQLRFWGSWGLDIRYQVPDMKIDKVSEDTWLGDRAVYLNLIFRPKNDGASEGNRVRILYDFQRGEVYVTSPLQLWRGPDYRGGNPGANWMTDSQFDSQLGALTP